MKRCDWFVKFLNTVVECWGNLHVVCNTLMNYLFLYNTMKLTIEDSKLLV